MIGHLCICSVLHPVSLPEDSGIGCRQQSSAEEGDAATPERAAVQTLTLFVTIVWSVRLLHCCRSSFVSLWFPWQNFTPHPPLRTWMGTSPPVGEEGGVSI